MTGSAYAKKGISFGFGVIKWSLIVLGIVALLALIGAYLFINSDQGKMITESLTKDPTKAKELIAVIGSNPGALTGSGSDSFIEAVNVQELKNQEIAGIESQTGARYALGAVPASLKVSNYEDVYVLNLKRDGSEIHFTVRNWGKSTLELHGITATISAKFVNDPVRKDFPIEVLKKSEKANIFASQHMDMKQDIFASPSLLDTPQMESWEIVQIDFGK